MPVQPDRYLEVDAADVIAGTLPNLTAWIGATSDAKTTALNQASIDIDRAMPYQGRLFDPMQARQFPRIADDDGSAHAPASTEAIIWDWDATAQAVIVPLNVQRAVVCQADAILSGLREARLGAQHDGVVYELTGSLAESYKQTSGPGVVTGLCRRAWILMRAYRLRSGRML